MYRLGLVCCAVIVLGTPARSAAEDRVQTVLNRAIEATGGAEALAKFKGLTYSQTATKYGPDGSVRVGTAKVYYVLPDKLRVETTTPDGKPVVNVFEGTHGSVKLGDRTDVLSAEVVKFLTEEMYLLRVTSLLPLRESGSNLTDLGSSTIDGRTVDGIKVSRDRHEDVQLYFDRDGGLLYKLVTRETDSKTGKLLDRQEVNSEYRDVGGLKVATHVTKTIDGKPYAEIKLKEVKCWEKLDDALFTKP
jgi:hypothetical protein